MYQNVILQFGRKMSSSGVLLIRDYRPGDELSCSEIVHEGTMSTVNKAFFSALIREVTFQLMVLASAVMFIFMGLPLQVCESWQSTFKN